jgi:hypothetical protein
MAEAGGPPLAGELTVVATLLALAATSKLFLFGLPVIIALDMLEALQ